MIDQRNINKGIDKIFWIILILYSDPGGIQTALNVNEIGFQVNLNDILFVILSICYFFIPKKDYLNDRDFKRIRYAMLIFLFYFFVIYGYLTPVLKSAEGYSFVFAIIKMRYALYCVQICLYIYVFFQRSASTFVKYYFISSVLILTIFLQSLFTGIEVLPIKIMSRGFIDVDRNLMLNYGLMPFLIPIGISFFVFRIKTRYRYYIIIGFSLMFTAWLVSLTRRHIFGTLIYLIIAVVLNNYFVRGSLNQIFRLTIRITTIIIILLMALRMTFPEYLVAGKDTIRETIYVLKYGETTTGEIDERLKFTRPFIVELIIKNPVLGTGFDNRWKNEEGDLEGYEASDYPFLGALAMFGILGILSFLPVYIMVIKILRKDIELLRRLTLKTSGVYFLILYTGIIFFIFDLMKYMHYFSPISLSGATQFPWYAYLGLYMGARKVFRINLTNSLYPAHLNSP